MDKKDAKKLVANIDNDKFIDAGNIFTKALNNEIRKIVQEAKSKMFGKSKNK